MRVTRLKYYSKLIFLGGQSEHSPGNRSAGVSTGEHAVLLLRVDHGWVNRQRGTGVHNRAGSVGN